MIRFVPGKSGTDGFHDSVKKIRSKVMQKAYFLQA